MSNRNQDFYHQQGYPEYTNNQNQNSTSPNDDRYYSHVLPGVNDDNFINNDQHNSFDPEHERRRARDAKREQRMQRTLQAQDSSPNEKTNTTSQDLKQSSPTKKSKDKRLTKSKHKKRSRTPDGEHKRSFWSFFSRVVTFWAPNSLIRCFGLTNKESMEAWREKIALVFIIVIICGIVGFLTFGLQQVLCKPQDRIHFDSVSDNQVVVNGYAYQVTDFLHPPSALTGNTPNSILSPPASAGKLDLSLMFQNPNSHCKKVLTYANGYADSQGNVVSVFPCVPVTIGQTNPISSNAGAFCHNTASSRATLSRIRHKTVYYTLNDIKKRTGYVIYNSAVLDLNRLNWIVNQVNVPERLKQAISVYVPNNDISLYLVILNSNYGKCLTELVKVGYIDTKSFGCIVSDIIMYVSLIVILSAVFSKFFMAVYFGWFMSRRLGANSYETPEQRARRLDDIENWADINNHYGNERIVPKYTVANKGVDAFKKNKSFFPTTSRYSHVMPGASPGTRDYSFPSKKSKSRGKPGHRHHSYFGVNDTSASLGSHIYSNPNFNPTSFGNSKSNQSLTYSDADVPNEVSPYDANLPDTDLEYLYTMLLVTCYSEGAHGIRTTLDSLVLTDYPDKYKCLFVICDGLITGEGESLSTPDICLSMMQDFVIPPDKIQAFSYVSIATGSKRHNMAKLYAGYYSPGENCDLAAKNRKVPMVLIVKCGTPSEESERKPGNRGKRDSQIIVMSFLQRAMFDERMSRLEYEMFNAIWNITGVTPDNFEVVLMVDADTKVYPDSLGKMVSVMANDNMVMGLCGETKIANKRDSYVSMIQVFEYYISHHLSKAFESVFGGVTCLPGCFCMYRIKTPKGSHGYWVPILANPDIVDRYSENIVDSLHKKNLLLLGEDRYLSTLMLKTFPKRKMIFVPSAVCKTIVPSDFKTLLSQRRRWMNSTVHNLLELVQVNDLCGTFCLSMQFIIFMELVGTVVLPAAILFTIYLIVISFVTKPVPVIPLVLLAIILGLPAVLISLTSRKLVYVGWMFVYLSGLIIWNLVLPVYAYWHFDDFSWGETRKVEGEGKGAGHGAAEGEFDSSNIVMKRWCDFESEKRHYTEMLLAANPSIMNNPRFSQAGSIAFGAQPSLSRASPASRGGSWLETHREDRGTMGHVFQAPDDQLAEVDASELYKNIHQLGYQVPAQAPRSSSYGNFDAGHHHQGSNSTSNIHAQYANGFAQQYGLQQNSSSERVMDGASFPQGMESSIPLDDLSEGFDNVEPSLLLHNRKKK
ncbi:hypothetical protein BB560_002876 [Smittium megazygosporum]|uniref:chitin synthase n=1 Tax=Smittium megazygosporum TaxID=133381 RepID=A0A2T9ZDI3_9FUNG|nr:hypothetical protein BB560_002876 [Smittium megazygosporum]